MGVSMANVCAAYRAAIRNEDPSGAEPPPELMDHSNVCADCAHWIDGELAEGSAWVDRHPRLMSVLTVLHWVSRTPRAFLMRGPRGRA
jgi:hypothetical protein